MTPFTSCVRLLAPLALLLAACGTPPPESDQSVAAWESAAGRMSDTSWFRGGQIERVNAAGGTVRLADFAGDFVWAHYAAPWCGDSGRQTTALAPLEREATVLTVLTSEMGGYGHPATRATAEGWAARFRLDPERVIAADLTALTLPRHILFSPDGQALYEHTGYLAGEEAAALLERYRDDWLRWKTQGIQAAWMR